MAKPLAVVNLEEHFANEILGVKEFRGEWTVRVKPERIVELCRFLKETPELDFDFLADLTAVDWYPEDPRFEVVYQLRSLGRHDQLRLKTPLSGENPVIASVTPVWATANWLEREVWDMFGIRFLGHPDLRRVFMPESYPFFPLRKDFPIEGIEPEKYIFGKE